MTTQTDFILAWNDLSHRLLRGIDALKVNRDTGAQNADDVARLTAKLDGLNAAKALYEQLNAAARVTGDFAGAWRTFTADAVALYKETNVADFGRGVALALEYQRGYSSDIDAPALPALLAAA